jgi:hypothetical protein
MGFLSLFAIGPPGRRRDFSLYWEHQPIAACFADQRRCVADGVKARHKLIKRPSKCQNRRL